MPGRRSRAAAGAAVAALLALAGLLAGCDRPRAGAAGAGTATTESGAQAVRGFHSPRDYRPTAVPVRLQIPRIGVDTALQRLGKGANGTVQTPGGAHKWDQAGWYDGEGGTRPGDPGSAVILGHVDSTSGPAVFYRVRELRRGDQIKVTTADGTVFRFAVDRVEQFPKSRFPTADVYYPTLKPKLRLVTCGGSFDFKIGHYRSNVIAFASLVS
jgi:sortase (surface protein transpeptidase)